VTRFERAAAHRIGVAHAVATVNGTAALHLALRAVGVGPGDEVLSPSLTFIATANSAVYLGAVPRFVDCERDTFGMDPVKLERWLEKDTRRRGRDTVSRSTGRRIGACVPTHIFGHPARIEAIVAVCRRFRIPVIEDAAESLGSTYRGKATGSFGIAGCLSFNGNKIITTGGGGMVVTGSAKLARTAQHLSTQAKKNSATYLHDAVGYNYRLPNLNAALGCAQMERLDIFLSRKRLVAQQYRKGLDGAAGLEFAWEPREAHSNFWLNTVVASSKRRARELMARLNDHGFESRPLWTPCHRQPIFEPLTAGPIDVVDRLWETAINVPSSSDLPLKAVDRICGLLRKS
jgi:perosamine synthetase